MGRNSPPLCPSLASCSLCPFRVALKPSLTPPAQVSLGGEGPGQRSSALRPSLRPRAGTLQIPREALSPEAEPVPKVRCPVGGWSLPFPEPAGSFHCWNCRLGTRLRCLLLLPVPPACLSVPRCLPWPCSPDFHGIPESAEAGAPLPLPSGPAPHLFFVTRNWSWMVIQGSPGLDVEIVCVPG